MNKFEKVSLEQYLSSQPERGISVAGELADLKLPTRKTKKSAGYDFHAPFDFTLKAGESIKIPTGIKVQVDDGWFLGIVPRSSLGFKYRLQLDNVIGIIDAKVN